MMYRFTESKTPIIMIMVVGASGCAQDLLPEGSSERDGFVDTAPEFDTGNWDSGAVEDTAIEPRPTSEEVCYPGPDFDYTVCLPLVEWDTSWGSDWTYPEPYANSVQYAAPVRFIDLETIESTTSLAPNFVLSELMSRSKGRFGLFQVHTVETLQTLRDESGGPIYVNSAYRSPDYNARVGGVEHSRHMFGDAVDITSEVLDLEELGALCSTLGADYVGYYETHIHCDWRNSSLDPAFFEHSDPRSARLPVHSVRMSRSGDLWEAPATGFDEGEPLRRWEAIDSEGRVLARHRGRSFRPPEATAVLTVRVGGQSTVHRELTPPQRERQ